MILIIFPEVYTYCTATMMKAAEASGKTAEERRAERRQRAVVGPLPDSFLRLAGTETGEAHTEVWAAKLTFAQVHMEQIHLDI